MIETQYIKARQELPSSISDKELKDKRKNFKNDFLEKLLPHISFTVLSEGETIILTGEHHFVSSEYVEKYNKEEREVKEKQHQENMFFLDVAQRNIFTVTKEDAEYFIGIETDLIDGWTTRVSRMMNFFYDCISLPGKSLEHDFSCVVVRCKSRRDYLPQVKELNGQKPTPEQYNAFLTKYCSTIRNYGLCFAFYSKGQTIGIRGSYDVCLMDPWELEEREDLFALVVVK